MKCDMGGELILKHNPTTDTPDLCPTLRGEVFRNSYRSSTEDMVARFVYHFGLSLKWCNAYGKMHANGKKHARKVLSQEVFLVKVET